MNVRKRSSAIPLLLLVILAAPLSSAAKTKPNLLLITIDTLRPDRLGCYGSPFLSTPAVDGLAARGVLFTRAFAHTPMTLPSHANILLGVTPPVHGVHDNGHFIVPADRPSLAPHLKSQGYATAAFVGAYPLDARFGLGRGFDVYDDDFGAQNFASRAYVERPAGAVVERAVAWIERQAGPWFAWVHCFDPHVPYAPPEPYLSRFRDRPYDGEVAFVDEALGRLFAALRAGGREAGTVVVFTADHGEALGEHGESTHGCFAYNSTIHVPLVIAAPGLAPRRTGALASHVDIVPTVCELLGVRLPAGLEGVSLVPAAKGGRLADRPFYIESLYPYFSRGWAPLRGVISGGRKFIDSPVPELYDLRKDFSEAADIAATTDLAPFRKTLAAFLVGGGRAGASAAAPPLDAAAREKLRSLGYVTGPTPRPAGPFTARDDIKTLLPFEMKTEEANRLAGEGKLDEAARRLKEILGERDDFDAAYTSLAALYKNSGRLADALAVLDLAREKLPRNYDIFLASVSYLLAAGRHADVVRLFEATDLPQRETDPEIWNSLGVARAGLGDPTGARAAYERALTLDPDYPAARTNLGTLGLILFLKSGDRAELGRAVKEFETAVAIDPRYAPGWNGLGAAAKESGDAARAAVAWEKALELEPGLGPALYNLGVLSLEQGKKERARALLLKYQELFGPRLNQAERDRLEGLLDRTIKQP